MCTLLYITTAEKLNFKSLCSYVNNIHKLKKELLALSIVFIVWSNIICIRYFLFATTLYPKLHNYLISELRNHGYSSYKYFENHGSMLKAWWRHEIYYKCSLCCAIPARSSDPSVCNCMLPTSNNDSIKEEVYINNTKQVNYHKPIDSNDLRSYTALYLIDGLITMHQLKEINFQT